MDEPFFFTTLFIKRLVHPNYRKTNLFSNHWYLFHYFPWRLGVVFVVLHDSNNGVSNKTSRNPQDRVTFDWLLRSRVCEEHNTALFNQPHTNTGGSNQNWS